MHCLCARGEIQIWKCEAPRDFSARPRPSLLKKELWIMTEAATTEVPATMKAAVATGFGDIDENIHVRTDWPTPALPEKGSYLLIRVLTCALAPGDVRVLSGATEYVQLPATGHPYVVGSDVAGIVVEVSKEEASGKFAVGDYVVSRFALPAPTGGCAEYRVVETKLTVKCPGSVPPAVACGLPASAVAAKLLVKQHMKIGDRVLVPGGSGAVGSSLLQYARLRGASFVATTSTQQELCRKLGADEVVDYRKVNWWEVPAYQSNKFDVVFDMVGGENWEMGGKAGIAVKRRGTYVAMPPGVRSEVHVHGVFDSIKLSFEWLGRSLWTRFNPILPIWVIGDGLTLQEGDLEGLLEDVRTRRLKPVLDPASPFDFTEEGLRKAFHLQKSCHAHGKVVIQISTKEESNCKTST
jgi:NADPH:quinone reductase-like Zn-dependent oxidoreductase